jgi:hypothetical protein
MADSCCSNIVVINETTSVIVAGGGQGPPGASINPTDYFQTANRFSELDTQEKKVEARQNLELQYIDCGTFN